MQLQPASWTDFEIQVHQNAVSCAKNYKRSEAELLKAIDAAERYRIYEKFDGTSIQLYCIDILELPEGAVNYFITVARKCRKIPKLLEKIEQQKISVSKAARACSVLNVENQDIWLEKMATLSKHELDREVAKANPKLAQQASLTPVAENATRMVVTVSDQFNEKLQRVRDLEAQRTKKVCSIDAALEAALDAYIAKHDPIKKAERAKRRAEGSARAVRPEHEVALRDGGQCTMVVRGKRCKERKWISLHHVQFQCEGGSDEAENLTTLCDAHHRLLHEREARPH